MNGSKAALAPRVVLKGLAAGVLTCLGWLFTTHFLSLPGHITAVSWLPVIGAAMLCTILFFAGKDPFWRWSFYTSILVAFLLRFLLLRSNVVHRFVWAGGGWRLADHMRDTPLYILLAALLLTGAFSFSLAFFQKRVSVGSPDIVPPLEEPPLHVSFVVFKGILAGVVFLLSWILTCHLTFSVPDPPGITMHISVLGMILSVLILNWGGTRCWGWSYLTAVLISSSVSVFLFFSLSRTISQFLFGVTEFTDGMGIFQTVAVMMLSSIPLRRKLFTAIFVWIVREYKRLWFFLRPGAERPGATRKMPAPAEGDDVGDVPEKPLRRVVIKGLLAGAVLSIGWLGTVWLVSRSGSRFWPASLPVLLSLLAGNLILFFRKDPFSSLSCITAALAALCICFPFSHLWRSGIILWGTAWTSSDLLWNTPWFILLGMLGFLGGCSLISRSAYRQRNDLLPASSSPGSAPSVSSQLLWRKGLLAALVYTLSWALSFHYHSYSILPFWMVDLISVAGAAICCLILCWGGLRHWEKSYLIGVLCSFIICLMLTFSNEMPTNHFLFGIDTYIDDDFFMMMALSFRRKLLTPVFVLMVSDYKRLRLCIAG